MRVSEFDFELPKESIAQQPSVPRDHSRLMVVHRDTGVIEHRRFDDIGEYLTAGDLLIFNDTKVFPCRLFGVRADTGGRVEVLLIRAEERDGVEQWEVMLRARRSTVGMNIQFEQGLVATVVSRESDRTWWVRLSLSGDALMRVLDDIGQTPLPPYITHSGLQEEELRQRYQTVYARVTGSVAAPTAGFHFTPELIDALTSARVSIANVTLHVGLGTFVPIETEHIEDHRMHAEWATVSPATADQINATRAGGGRVVAVGTTSVRTLETFASDGVLRSGAQWTSIFITPGYAFQCVDAMITNFHLPQSTLLVLVSSFAGVELMRRAYSEAIAQRYRFYSFGDAMLIL